MLKFPLLFLSTLIIVLLSCSEDGTGPKPKPPGYQEDIPWPSLADTPWPTYSANMQRTNRTNFKAPVNGELYKTLDNYFNESSFVVGADSNIYFGSSYGVLHSLDKNFNENWNKQITPSGLEINSAPVILSDNTIVISNQNGKEILSLNNLGNILWAFPLDKIVSNIGIAVDLDTNIYFVDYDRTLYSINNKGQLNWKMEGYNFSSESAHALAFSPDGTILYVKGRNPTLYAVDVNIPNIVWTFGEDDNSNSPLVDNQGNIYLLMKLNPSRHTGELVSLSSTGSLNWSISINNRVLFNVAFGLCMNSDGDLLMAYDSLYSVSFEGMLNWKIPLEDHTVVEPICDTDDFIMVQTTSDQIVKPAIYTKNGILFHQIDTGLNYLTGWPGIITYDGWIIPSFGTGKIFIFR